MACGVSKTFADGKVVVCDNLGTSTHTGLHSGVTEEFWLNLGFKVRTRWAASDRTPARQKPIIRGDHFAPLPEGEVLPPEGSSGRFYSSDFTGLADVPGNIGVDWTQVMGPVTGRVLGESVVIPGNLGSNSGKTTWAYTYKGGDNSGKFNGDNWEINLQAVPTTRSVANNMSCSILGAVSDVWGTVFECALFPGQPIQFIYDNAIRATSTYSATTDLTYTLRRTGNLFQLWASSRVEPVLEWDDVNQIVAKGPTFRKWGFSVQANYPLFQRQYDSHGVDWITGEDVA